MTGDGKGAQIKFGGGTKTWFIGIWECGPTEESVQREFSRILRWRPKKGLRFKQYANFHKFWSLSQKTISVPKSQKFSRILRWRQTQKKGLSKFLQILLFIPKNVRTSTSSEVKTKKGLPPKICANFHKSWDEATKAVGVYCKIYEKTVLAHEFQGDNQYFSSNCTPIAPSLLIFWGTSLAWGAQLLFGGAQFSFGGGHKQSLRGDTAPECSPVAPGLRCLCHVDYFLTPILPYKPLHKLRTRPISTWKLI